MRNDPLYESLTYVKNSGGGATKDNFIEDYEPIGQILWNDLIQDQLVTEDQNGKIWLTPDGEKRLKREDR